MDQSTLERLKTNLFSRLQNISSFLESAPATVLRMRRGPVNELAVRAELALLHSSVQKAEDNTLGLCRVCNDFVDSSRLEMDYTANVCLEHLTTDERRTLENDLELSVKVQQALLPQSLPQIEGVDIAVYSQPARIVGGDYFDFLRFHDGAHAIMIADVMGKGMPASMLVASLQASLRIIAPESREPAEVMTRLNQLFCHNVRLTNFVTVFLGKYDERARTLTYCNAGHNPPIVVRTRGTVENLDSTGAAIGLVGQTEFEQERIDLNDAAAALLYTDGVVESSDAKGLFFGEERLGDFVRGHCHGRARDILAELRGQLQTFTGQSIPADDTTMIMMRWGS